MSFWNGFEKRAYDYAYERKAREKHYDAVSKQTPAPKGKSALVGGAVGTGVGGLYGALLGGKRGIVPGVATGAFVGALAGYGNNSIHRARIEHAKKITDMSPKSRAEYIRHILHQEELDRIEEALEQSRQPTHHYHIRTVTEAAKKEEPKAPTGSCPSCGSPQTKKTANGFSCAHCGNLRKSAGEINRTMKAMGFSGESRKNFARQIRGERALKRINPDSPAFEAMHKKQPVLGVFDKTRGASGEIPRRGSRFNIHLKDFAKGQKKTVSGKAVEHVSKNVAKSRLFPKALGGAASLAALGFAGHRAYRHISQEKSTPSVT